MNSFISFALIVLLSGLAFGQKQQRPPSKTTASAKKTVSKPKAAPAPAPADPVAEKAKLDDILALPSAAERASALKKFINDFPDSDEKARAVESLVIARAIFADEKLQANESSDGIAIFKLAVAEAPTPIPERLFNEIVSKFPANLYFRGQREAGLEIAAAIEKKAAGNEKQLTNLATFFLSIEGGAEARRLAEAAIAIDPNSVAAHQTLGLAHRLNFDLEESARSYAKALELDNTSVASKRSLAEMKRALGYPDEAAVLYREMIAADETDAAARTGLILSLFGAGKRADAETEMAKSLEQNPKNLGLLAGAAYWYAANDLPEKAVEFAQKAVELEPRYIWGHIALARGLMKQNKPVDAERVLVTARAYGNFPTLEYEIASARMMSGFYREAAEELQKSFEIKDGLVRTRLGRRVPRAEKTFAGLLAYERRASIFEPAAADNAENSAKLKLLFELTQKLNSPAPDEAEVSTLTDEFVGGEDKMKLHRQIYSANMLLQKNVALPKVLELTKSAVGNADSGLDVPAPSAAVMASELYESRVIAFARNEIIVVPEVPRQTLSAILRGRIEELAGWALYKQKSYPEAVVRLRRALSVLPDKSAWWRSTMWRLGAALKGDGKDQEALDSYIASYKTDRPNQFKYAEIEALYTKVHGSTDGLEARVGPDRVPVTVAGTARETQTAPSPVQAERPTVKIPAHLVDPVVSVKREAEKTQSLEVSTKTVAPDLPKPVDVPAADKQETKSEVTEAALKTPEPAEVKADIVPSTDKPEETKPIIVSAAPEKTANEAELKTESPAPADKPAEPKAETTLPADKPVDVSSQPAEIPVKRTEEEKSQTENPKVQPVDQKVSIEPVEPPKTEAAQPSPPETEQSKKKDAEIPAEPEVIPPASKTDEKPIEKAEPEQPKTDVPKSDEPVTEERKEPVQDPVVPDEPESKKEPPPETKPPDLPAVSKIEKAAATKTVVIIDDPLGALPQPSNTASKTPPDKPSSTVSKTLSNTPIRGLFEPVIITAPSSSSPKPVKKAAENPFEPVVIEVSDSSASKAAKKGSEKPAETDADPLKVKKPVDETISSGATRVRVIDGLAISSGIRCSLDLSHDSISIINEGGSLGVMATINGEGDVKNIISKSSSPDDVTVTAEPGLKGSTGRRFFVIRSVSPQTGVFQVTFESGCGTKEILVRVR